MKKRFALALAAVALGLTLFAQLAPPPNPTPWVSLGWTASPSQAVNNYTIYVGTAPGVYNSKVAVGNVTSGTISNLARGFTYYFNVTASDTNGLESVFSNEVLWTAAGIPPAPTQTTLTGGHH